MSPFVIPPNPAPPIPITAVQPTSPVTPHVQMPFAFNANGRPTYCDQDTVEDVQSCVLNLLSCQVGANPYDENFGRPDFRGDPEPLQLQGLVAAVTQYEGRLSNLGAQESLDIVNRATQIVVAGSVTTTGV